MKECCQSVSLLSEGVVSPAFWFSDMIQNCLAYAKAQHQTGRPIVGIMCEYTPRELILAAGAIPVCLCGGCAETIPAAEEHLPANLCPLIKSTYGYHLLGSNPFLEMAQLVVAETTCDGKKKMFELMSLTRPMYVLELPHKDSDPDAREHWRRELVKFKSHLESTFNVAITDDKLHEAIASMNRERRLRRELASLMKKDCPPFTGRQLLDFRSSISAVEADFIQYERAIEQYASQPEDPSLAGRVRVLMTGVPIPHGAERVLEILENSGGLVVCMENCSGLKPILDDVSVTPSFDKVDLLSAIADKYFAMPCSVKTGNEARRKTLHKLAKEYRVQCIVELVWQACLTYDVESFFIKRLAEEEFGIPYLRIGTDYSPSDSARIAVRVEALFESVGQRLGIP